VRRKAVAEAKKSRSDGARHAAATPAGGAGIGRAAASAKDDPLDGFIGSRAGAPAKSSKADVDDELDRIASGGPPRDKAPATGGGSASAQRPPAAEKPMANLSSRPVAKKKASSDVEEMGEKRVRAKEEARDDLLEGGGRAYAQPPPPAAAPAPRYAEAPPAPRAIAEAESASAADESADLAKSAPRRVERRASGGKAAPAPEPLPAPVVASRARSRDGEAESGESDQAASRETLLQRADRLFTQGRWAEAAIAYRDLLRQQPNSPSAERWRRRLAAARTAVATGRPPPPSAR
jgi:hypothetical protein